MIDLKKNCILFCRLFFAGTESATVWNGFINGAVQAGIRAANEVEYWFEFFVQYRVKLTHWPLGDLDAICNFQSRFIDWYLHIM